MSRRAEQSHLYAHPDLTTRRITQIMTVFNVEILDKFVPNGEHRA